MAASHEHPRLSRELVASLAVGSNGDLDVPPPEILGLPERIVQFGTGAFLRGFAEFFVDEANRKGQYDGSIVAVSSTGSSRDAMLNEQDGLFTLASQGMEGGSARQRYRIVGSLSRALSARDNWDDILALARDEHVDAVISNTTEVGIVFDESDTFDARPPRSFPGKLTRFLYERARACDFDPECGLVVLPCELIEDNGETLCAIVHQLARHWKLEHRFTSWLTDAVEFCNTLVDRIVPGAPPKDEAQRIERVFGYRDGLITTCETYALFAIEGDEHLRQRIGFISDDPRVIVTRDIRPYRERKVRILNGGHTISVPVALLAGLETVRDAVTDTAVGAFVRRAMLEEIVPSLDVPDAESFARDVLARFANPYIRHALIDITLYGTTKMRVRVVPSILAYADRFARAPNKLAFGFAEYRGVLRGGVQKERRAAGKSVPEDAEGDRVRDAWRDVDLRSDEAVAAVARRVCADTSLWSLDLSAVPGFAALAGEHLVRIVRGGVRAALEASVNEPVSSNS
jgi:tagaturonate reductase